MKSLSLQRFGELLHQCLQAYKEEYPVPFGEHYSYTEVTQSSPKKIEWTDFRNLCKDLQVLVTDQDLVGSLSFQSGFFSALLVTDPFSREKINGMLKSFKQD